jgi:hypothetical protein
MSFSPKVPDRSIRVSFYDNDGVRVDNVTKKQAKVIADASPGKLFYFQDKNGLQRELTIAQVLALKPEKDLISNTAFSNAGCPTDPQRCGPPKVQFFGGEGVGAMANAVISPISSGVMAFDIVNPGKKYKDAPIAVLDDECGKGSGSSLKVIMDGDKIKNVFIDAPGDGYLNNFDGSFGGNGRTWKEADEGYVKTKQGEYYTVPDDRKPPGLGPGDTWYPPYGPPTVEPEIPTPPPPPTQPEVPPTIPPVVPPTEPVAPEVPPAVPPAVPPVAPVPGPAPVPSPSSPTYKVLICFDGVVIDDPGFGYKPGDRITITPDNGTVLRPIVNSRGEIATVEIVTKGCGFDDLPQIVVESQTGFNAVIKPILNATRLNEEELFEIPPETKLVSVVDCVGIIPPKTTFDIVPR